MKILEITSQSRRDFYAKMVCEGCGHTQKLSGGYDDRYYHDNVIPEIKCEQCGESRNSLGIKGDFTQTKYNDWQVI
jgi:ribosomal protein S27E